MKHVLILVAIVFVISGLTCVLRRTVIETHRSTGRPFDHMGDLIKCPKCGQGGTKAGRGYWYNCPHCKEHYRMRWNADEKRIDVDW